MPGKKPGKCLFRAGHFAQLSPEIGARIAIQTARTWMDMDIKGSHRTYAFSLRKKNTRVTFFLDTTLSSLDGSRQTNNPAS